MGGPPQGLYGHGKTLSVNIDMVEWFSQVLGRSDV